jgi:hypothetical protein
MRYIEGRAARSRSAFLRLPAARWATALAHKSLKKLSTLDAAFAVRATLDALAFTSDGTDPGSPGRVYRA